VTLIIDELTNVLVINKGPFVNGSGIQKVFSISREQANRVEATIGLGNRDYYHVKQGLNEGDEIIISDVSTFINLSTIDID